MTAKLHVNLSQGIIDVEGDPDLVRAIYYDFKDQLLDGLKANGGAMPASQPAFAETPEQSSESVVKPKTKRRSPTKKKASTEDSDNGISADHPKLDKNIDTTALPAFYAEYAPKNHSDKILMFLKFLMDKLNIDAPNTDQVFTCYKAVNEKFPQAFKQAFHTANTKYGYIDFKSATDIKIPIAGENHFAHGLKKNPAE